MINDRGAFNFWLGLLLSSLVCVSAIAQSPAPTESFTLEKLLALMEASSSEIKSVNLEIKALEAEIRGRDHVLAPSLELNAESTKDNRESFSSTASSSTKDYDLTFTLPIPTGTEIVAESNLTSESLKNTTPRDRETVAWEVRLEQSLWRDSFGSGTRARQRADLAEGKARRFDLLYKRQKYLVDLEAIYWDLVASTKELSVRQANSERADQIYNWVRGRLSRSAAERTDLLQADALIKNRKLELKRVQNDIESTWLKVQQVLPQLRQGVDWQPNLVELETDRDFKSLFLGSKSGGTPVHLQTLASHYRSDQTAAKAEQVANSLRPELTLYAGYGANAIDQERDAAIDEISDDPHEFTEIGVNFKADLDFGRMADLRASAAALAESEKLQAELRKAQSSLAWNDLQRELKSLKEQSVIARDIADTQAKKSLEERRRFQQGRTTLFQAVTFEEDAAEAELRAIQSLVKLRKTEAQSRLFAEEVL